MTDIVAEALQETGIASADVPDEVKLSANPLVDAPVEAAPAFQQAVAEANTMLDLLMAKIGDVGATDKYLKLLVYGMPGTRKTSFLGTAPKPLIIDVEHGTKSLNNHPDLKANVKVLDFRSIFQAEQLLNFLGMNPVPEQLADRETLCVDSFSELSKRDLDEIVADAASKDAARNKYLPIGPDYNISTEHMRQFASKLRDLPMHVIITCHVKEEKDEASGRLLVRPNLTPKLAGTLAGMFDLVGYMQLDSESDTCKLQVHPTANVTAKTRIGGLTPIIDNPTFNTIFEAFKKGTN